MSISGSVAPGEAQAVLANSGAAFIAVITNPALRQRLPTSPCP